MDPLAVRPPPDVLQGGDDLPAPLTDLAGRVRLVALRIDELDLFVLALALEVLRLRPQWARAGGLLLPSLPLLIANSDPKSGRTVMVGPCG